MAGKLNIRRVGSLMPMLCLLVMTAIGVAVAWLGTQGLPESILRYAETKAAEQGVYLKISSARGDMVQGPALRVEGISLYPDAARREKPLATVQRVTIGLNFARLLRGEIWPSVMRVEGGDIQLPSDDAGGRVLHISDIRLLGSGHGDALRITSGSLRVQGVPITLRVGMARESLQRLLREHGAEKTEKFDRGNLLRKNKEILAQVCRIIDDQHWQPEQVPSLELHLTWNEDLRASLRCNIPYYNHEPFQFRDALIDIDYAHDAITINSLRFKTVEPDTAAALQGYYSIKERHLSGNIRSDAALLAMMQRFGGDKVQKYLSKFSHAPENPPHLNMDGDVVFEENFSLRSIKARGEAEQKHLGIGSSLVEEAKLSFYYDNGDFNIDRMELKLPEGSLQIQASARAGKGQAQIMADLKVQRVLTLLRDLADVEIELPTGLSLDDRVNLQLHAQLDAPAFRPGGTHWTDFVPTFHTLSLCMKTKELAYGELRLENPELELRMEGVENLTDDEPGEVGQMQATVRAYQAEFAAAQAGGLRGCTLRMPVLEATLQGISLMPNGMPRHVKTAQLDFKAEEVDGQFGLAARGVPPVDGEQEKAAESDDGQDMPTAEEGAPGLAVRNPSAHLVMQDVRLEGAQSGSAVIDSAALTVQTEDVSHGEWKVESAGLSLDDVRGVYLRDGVFGLPSTAHLQTKLHRLVRGEVALGEVELCVNLRGEVGGDVQLLFTPSKQAASPVTLRGTVSRDERNQFCLHDVQLYVPGEALTLVPELMGGEPEDLQMPKELTVQGTATLDPGGKLIETDMEVQAPGLVRTPHRQAAFQGKQIPLDIQARIHAQRAEGDHILYRVQLGVAHNTGRLDALINGSSEGRLRVTGTNTIRPDVVDVLIDSGKAHSIIRDFRFNEASKSTITDIAVDVDYRAGLVVDSFCQVKLENAEYLLSAIEEVQEGERLRRDLGGNPYTKVNLATCAVLAHVRLDGKDEDGAPLPDETVVTIQDPVLVYDNTPWLRRNKIPGGKRESRLAGQAVVIDVERSFVELRQVKGTIYPAYSLGMFFADLYEYLEDVNLPYPAEVETAHCLFPIYDDCKEAMTGTIRVEAPHAATFRFLGTQIPMESFSGFISLSDDAVLLDRMHARTWEGVLNASVRILISGRHTGFDGCVRADCMNLQQIAAAYDSKQFPALCSGEIRFNSPSSDLDKIRAYGNVSIVDGDLISLSIFRPVGSFITDLPTHFENLEQEARARLGKQKTNPGIFMRFFKSVFKNLGRVVGRTGGNISKTASNIPGMNHLIAYDLQEAHANFHIKDGWIQTNDMVASGSNLNVQLHAAINLDSLQMVGNLWPHISSLPSIVLSPLSFLSDFMVDIVLYGQATDPKWRISLDRRIYKNASPKNRQ